MKFNNALNTGDRLNDFEGHIVGLADLGMTIQDTQEWGERPALRARFVVIVEDVAKDMGETLVFSKSVYQKVAAQPKGEGLIGTLVKVPHPNPVEVGQTYWLVQPLEPQALATAKALFHALFV